ncbi:MAG TPA: hypothetical protein VLB12_14750 [Gemmatimonadales bacterium]|nr:hypothetical protein [Gemmatimonadales bacterium]
MRSRGPYLDSRGVALPLTLIVLTVLMLLTGTGLMFARLESRSADQTLAVTQATAAAEEGFEIAAADWPIEAWDTLPPGVAVASASGAFGRQLHVDSITHLGGSIYLQTAVGEVRDAGGGPLARAALGRWMRADPPRFPDRAAIMARGLLELGGGMNVDGADMVPPGWGPVCPPGGSAVAAMADSTGPPLFSSGCVGGSCLTGSPSLMVDSTVSDSLLSHFGGAWDFTTLRAAASQHLAGLISAPGPALDSVTSRCNPTAPTNLGEPLDSSSPCFPFFPIISVASGSRIERGRGQGVLLADGDLELADGFEFYGVVVVAGRLTIAGAGTRVTGLVLLRHSPSDTARLTGVGSVALSRCAIARAAGRSTPLRLLSGRSWSRF